MLPVPNTDATPGLRGEARCLDRVVKQELWIQWCEANGVSYTGENGTAIRQADLNELGRWESELRFWRGS